MLTDGQVYVRYNGRKALFRQKANVEYWTANWGTIPEERLRHILRPTTQLGVHNRFFRNHLSSTGLVLEAGCGTGLWVRRLRENNWNCIGLDYAVKSLARSKEIYSELPLVGGDVFKLPFASNSVMAYISFGVVEHFPEGPGPILRECARVLQPGGVALISVPYNSPVRRNLQTVSAQRAHALGLEFYQYYFTLADFSQQLILAELEPSGVFHGYDVSAGLVGPVAFLRQWVRRLGLFAQFLDLVPGLPRLAAHMMFVSATKPAPIG